MATTFVALSGVEEAPLQDGAIVFCPGNGKFLMLNRSAAAIWTELAKPKTEDDLVLAICSKFPDADTATAQRDVAVAVAQFREFGLVSVSD